MWLLSKHGEETWAVRYTVTRTKLGGGEGRRSLSEKCPARQGGKKRALEKSMPLKSYSENIVSEISKKRRERVLRRWRKRRKCVEE